MGLFSRGNNTEPTPPNAPEGGYWDGNIYVAPNHGRETNRQNIFVDSANNIWRKVPDAKKGK